jgi:hypothetical protein
VAKGDPDADQVTAAVRQTIAELPAGPVVLGDGSTEQRSRLCADLGVMCTYYPALREVLVAADPSAGICTKVVSEGRHDPVVHLRRSALSCGFERFAASRRHGPRAGTGQLRPAWVCGRLTMHVPVVRHTPLIIGEGTHLIINFGI